MTFLQWVTQATERIFGKYEAGIRNGQCIKCGHPCEPTAPVHHPGCPLVNRVSKGKRAA